METRGGNDLAAVGALSVFIYPLGFYYSPMLCLITDYCDFARFGQGEEPWILMIGLWFYIIGIFYHYCADLQKHVQLSLERPRRLITGKSSLRTRGIQTTLVSS